MKRMITVLAVALIMAAMFVATAMPAFAKITPVCQNPGGQEPQGNCQGQALTEENQNPAGKAPPGQNK
jgi:hypothetical protein